MAIEDSKKKKKVITNRNQRVTVGQATGGGASVNNAGNTGVIEPKTLGDFATGREEGAISATRIPIQSGGSKGSLADFSTPNNNFFRRAVGEQTSEGFNNIEDNFDRHGVVGGGAASVIDTVKRAGKGLGQLSNMVAGGVGVSDQDVINTAFGTPEVSTNPSTPLSDVVTPTSVESEGAIRQRQLLGEGSTAQSPVIDESKVESGVQIGKSSVIFGDTSNTANSVDYGSPEANVAAAERFRTGTQRGSVTTLEPGAIKNIREGDRLTNARSAVAKLKAGGASASAQLEAFKRISSGGEEDRRQSMIDQFQRATSRGDDLGAREISRSIDRFDTAKQSQKASEAGIETNNQRLEATAAKVQKTLRDEGIKFDEGTNKLLQDLVKVDPISGKSVFDLATRSDQITRRLGNKNISANMFQSLFPDFFRDGITNSSLEVFRADPRISDTLELKARDALIAKQSRR